MIDRIYRMVRFLCNNTLRGNVTPNEFDLALYKAILDIYDGYFFDLTRLTNRLNRGLTGNDWADVPEQLRFKIRYYLTEGTTFVASVAGDISLPNDLEYIDGVFINGAEAEPIENARQFKLLEKHQNLMVDAQYPIYIQRGRIISALPAITVTDDVAVSYLRKPLFPKWTYDVVNGNEVFNPSASDFQDADIDGSEENNLTIKVLAQFGINLKEQDLAQYAIAMEAGEVQSQNAS